MSHHQAADDVAMVAQCSMRCDHLTRALYKHGHRGTPKEGGDIETASEAHGSTAAMELELLPVSSGRKRCLVSQTCEMSNNSIAQRRAASCQ